MQSNPQPRQRRSQRYRAQYPEDTQGQPSYPVYPDYNAPSQQPGYPQEPYQPYQRPRQPAYPQEQYPPYPQYQPYTQPYRQPDPYAPVTPPPPRGNNYDSPRPPRKNHSGDGKWLLLIILCIALLAGGGFWISGIYSANYPVFEEKLKAMATDRFYNGVHVDGVHLGGMTMEEARIAVRQHADYSDEAYAMNVTVDGKTWRITQNELPLKRNTEAVLKEAFTIGRQGTLSTLGTDTTPFEMRYQHALQTNRQGAFLYTEITYDKSTVRALAETIAARVYVEPRDASVHSFDANARSFKFNPEQVGAYINAEDIYNNIVANMDARNYNASIALSTRQIIPNTTAATLSQSFGLVASYTTNTTAEYNRNVNIRIASQAISKEVKNGETFSFNETTGRRTVDKGYLDAGVIISGASDTGIGGGICQVSSTLFNAVVLANMEITDRDPHAWPSNYVDPGRDATVDWQSYQTLAQSVDFKFKNTSGHPIYIVAYLSGSNLNRACKCTVEIYGVAFNPGITIGVTTELVSSTPTPTEEERVFNPELPYGQEKEVRKARPGYQYNTYRVYYMNGVETGRERVCRSNYRTYTRKVEYNY
ncbi:MAG: VanW family protein [Clostridia bacterium]|nr:VanW family protein [Clostridia bacterium]